MRNATLTWGGFGLCSVILVITLGWISTSLLDLERERQQAQQRELRMERMRLAIWRIDSLVAPVLAQEAARPHFHYQAFYSPARAYTHRWKEVGSKEVFVPSPILVRPASWMRLHFQISRDGVWSSPQVPTGQMLERAQLSRAAVRREQEQIDRLKALGAGRQLWARLGEARDSRGRDFLALLVETGEHGQTSFNARSNLILSNDKQQNAKQQKDWDIRQGSFNRQVAQNYYQNSGEVPQQGPKKSLAAVQLRRSPLVPAWIPQSKDLFLVRQVSVGKQQLLQGFVIDWQILGQLARSEVADIFPAARLKPRRPGEQINLDNAITVLPGSLDPGEPIAEIPAGWTPMRIGLVLVWSCLGVALFTVMTGLRGVLRLNQRRLEFVSAVTHELRTPLTTFQMYTDMLVEGMVTDEAVRNSYLETLRSESMRLSHLVQNVLEYSRLEDRNWQPRLSEIRLAELLGSCQTSLEERCARGQMRLVVDCDLPLETQLTTDASAVGQILFNLVDNACKYASAADNREVTLRISGPGPLIFEVIDHGPGLPDGDIKRLLKPFQRGQHEDSPQPGIGLGLSLAERWARQLGGQISVQPGPGGRFILTLN